MKKYLLVFAFSFFEFFVFGQSKLQSLNSDWPNDWKIIVLFHDSTTHQSITQLIPNNENIAKWSIIGNMMVLKNYKSQSLETVLNVFLKTHKEESSKAKIKI